MAKERERKEGARLARDFMTAKPECVTEKDSITDVARIMKDKDTGVVPVVNERKVIGLITDRDIVVRGIADGKDIPNTQVKDLMTKNIRSVREDADINEVLTVMRGAEIRRVPVVNESNELVGIISIGDIATDANEPGRVGKMIEDISEAPPNN